ncbi:MAG: hypothetical protein ACOCY0_03820, partial [Roseicyclus sp.]
GAPWLVTVGAATGATATGPAAAPYSGTPLPEASPLNRAEWVDRSAVAERSTIRRGVLAAGTLSGSRVAMGGTSAAAPQIVRSIVEGTNAPPPGPGGSRRLGASVLPPPPDLRRKPRP